jgi:hypothetical protein
VPNQKAFEVETPDDQIKMHQLLLAVAKKGSGKSTAVCNLLSFLKKDKVLDRLFVITSTYESNKPLFDFLGLPVEKEDVYNPDDPPNDTIEDIIDKVTQETREYDEYKRKKYLHEKMKQALKTVKTDRDIGNLDPALLIAAYDDDVVERPPVHKYNGKMPVLALFIDDSQSTPLFTSRKFLNLCIRHRHIGSSDDTRMGLSIFICVQNYTAQHGGIPKAIRDNVSTMMLYKTRSEMVLKTIMQDISDEITDEEFEDVYKRACVDKHDFLFIDWAPKQHRFRRNFDEYLPVASDPAQDGKSGTDKGGDKHKSGSNHSTKEGKIARRVEGEVGRGVGLSVPKLR